MNVCWTIRWLLLGEGAYARAPEAPTLRFMTSSSAPLAVEQWQQFEDRYAEYPFNPIGHGSERVSTYADADGFVEVAEAPTGFMCIKRDVFTRMMAKYPELKYTPDGPPNPQAHLHWLFFDCMVDPDSGRYLSEDYAFCRRWIDIGGKVWVDLQSKLLHLGQHNFGGDLAESLKLQNRW